MALAQIPGGQEGSSPAVRTDTSPTGITGTTQVEQQQSPTGQSSAEQQKSKSTLKLKLAEVKRTSTPEERVKEIFLSPEAKKTLVDTLEDQYLRFKRLQADSATAFLLTDTWQQEFLNDFEATFPGVNEANLRKCAEEYLARSDRIVLALQLARWEKATRQMQTGAMVKIVGSEKKGERPAGAPEEEKVVSEAVEVGRGGAEEAKVETKATKLGKILKIVTGGRNFGPQVPADKLSEAVAKIQKERAAEEKKRKTVVYQVVFDKEPPVANNEIDGLDSLQKAYLNLLNRNGSALTPEEQRFVIKRMQDITNLEVEIYANSGVPVSDIKLNYITKDSRGNRTFVEAAKLKSVFFPEEKVAVTTTSQSEDTAKAALEEYIKASLQDIAARTKKEFDDAFAKNDRERTLAKINDQIDKLSQQEGLTEAEVKRQEALQREIEGLQAKLTKVEEAKKLFEQNQQLAEERGEIEARVPEQVRLTLNAPVNDAGTPVAGSLIEAKLKEQSLTRELETVKTKQSTLLELYKAAVAAKNNAEATALREELTGEDGVFKRYNKISAQLSDAVAVRERIEEVIHKYAEELKRLDEIATQEKTNQAKIQQVCTEFSISVDRGLQASIDEVKKSISAKTMEKDAIGKPDEYRERKKETYTELKDRLGHYDEIQARAYRQELLDRTFEQEASLYADYYQNYPTVYIRVLQILYGPDVVLPGKQNQEAFKRATTLLPPEKFLQIFNSRPRVSDSEVIASIYEDSLKEIDFLHKVNVDFINDILRQLQTEALSGTLGDVPEEEKAEITKIKSVVVEEGGEIDTGLADDFKKVYHYRDINDLVRQVCIVKGINLNEATGDNLKKIKVYAVEEDRRRQERLKS